MALGRYREAIEHFTKSASLNPGYPRSWAGLTAANALAGEMNAARRHADKLRAFAPGADDEALIRRFGRNKKHSPKLHEGLRLALAPVEDP
jgi:Flp pilus assembly protein TadD